MERNGFSLARKKVSTGAMMFYCKNWLPHNFNNVYQGQKEYYITKEYFFTKAEKGFTAFVSTSGNYYWN